MSTSVQTLDPVITCVACGLTYSVSQGRDSCGSCPLHEDCSTSCCPNCGTSNINPDKSRLARWVQRLFVRHSVAEPVEAPRSPNEVRSVIELAEGDLVVLPVGVPRQAREDQPVEPPVNVPVEAPRSPNEERSVIEPVVLPVGVPRQAREDQPVEPPVNVPVEAPRSPNEVRSVIEPVEGRTLAGVKPGREVLVTGYGNLSGGQRQHLQAYGLLPGRRVRVLAQRPVTIVQVEETELAFETGIAAGVLVGD